MRTRTFGLALLATAILSVLTVSSARAVTGQNQCPGDCSPCLGDEDPFCPHGDDPGSGGTGPDGQGQCQWCKPNRNYGNRPTCEYVEEGESGKTNCTMVWEETTPVSCSTAGGYYCAYIIVVTP